MARAVIVDVLLGLAVAVVLASAAGVLLMRDAYQKVHYVTPVSVIAPVLVGLAISVQSGWTASSGQSWLVVALMVLASPFLAHATVRAIWIREHGGAGRDTGRAGQDAERQDAERQEAERQEREKL
jgi:multisubunit Na+/H+ antiporter MnhG subunit